MIRLTWVQPEDLVAHGIVASEGEGRPVERVRRRWMLAGGSALPARAGASTVPASAELRTLAVDLLDELDALPVPTALEQDEPEDLAQIESSRSMDLPVRAPAALDDVRDRVHGAWLGRAAGCLLGKPVEKLPREGIRAILESTGRWPLDQWFTAQGLPADVAAQWPWNRRSAATSLAENIKGMPEDDDLNFSLIALSLLERAGPFFSTEDVAHAWLDGLPAGRVFTAERVAYRNLLLGYDPPHTATRRNPFREWIGAQIRTDVYGWANPGDPATAARAAWRDARLSHTRSGVYGAMAVAAMCSVAVVASDVDEVLDAGLAVVPPRSRYAAAFRRGVELGRATTSAERSLDALYAEYGALHWVHSLNNAALVAFALTRARGHLTNGICTAVAGGWDTDSDGATVGSICGALSGASGLPERWIAPLQGRLASSLPGFDGAGFSDLADRTLSLAAR